MTEQHRTVFLKIPPLEDLTRLVCSINLAEKRDRSALSIFHWQILKCRMVIFSTYQVLASPDLFVNNNIIIIFQRNTMNLNKLQDLLKKLFIQVVQSTEVTPRFFESCFKYTLSARIAPLWNLMDVNIFTAGRDFLSCQQPLDAIMLNVHVSEELISVNIKCYKIRLGNLRVEDLCMVPSAFKHFSNVDDAVLSENSIMDQWVHVLPSLKKGRIISVNRKMPKSSSFATYKDLRRHWKNIYGYRLPDTDENLIYYELHFRPLGDQLYTYPSVCLRPRYPILTSPTQLHSNEITVRFLQDLKLQLPSLFGFEMNFGNLESLFLNMPISNIENAPRPQQVVKKIAQGDNPELPLNDLNSTHYNNIVLTQNISLCTPTQRNNYYETQKATPSSDRILPKFFKKGTFCSNKKISVDFSPIQEFESNKSKQQNGSVFETNKWPAEEIVTPKVIPSFDKLIPKPTINNSLKKTSALKPPKHINAASKTIHCPASQENKTQSHDILTMETILTKTLFFKPVMTQCGILNNINPSLQQNITVQSTSVSTVKGSFMVTHSNTQMPFFSKNVFSDIPTINTSALKSKTSLSQNKKKNNAVPSKSVEKAGKRKGEKDSESSSSKHKPAEDPAGIPDVAAIARRDVKDVGKINVRTLYLWLNSQKVTATTRMTKPQLLEKVYQHLNIRPA